MVVQFFYYEEIKRDLNRILILYMSVGVMKD
jgi:hypothetical protein